MDDEKTTQNDKVKTDGALLSDLPTKEDDAESVKAGPGAALQLNSCLTVASENLRP